MGCIIMRPDRVFSPGFHIICCVPYFILQQIKRKRIAWWDRKLPNHLVLTAFGHNSIWVDRESVEDLGLYIHGEILKSCIL